MKTLWNILIICSISIAMTSCSKEEDPIYGQGSGFQNYGHDPDPCITDVTLRQNNGVVVGYMSLRNDPSNLHVTINLYPGKSKNGYWLLGAQLFTGDGSRLSPEPSSFPNQKSYAARTTSKHTFVIPHASMGSCFTVSAHVDMQRSASKKGPIIIEDAWAAGVEVSPGSPARQFDYCKTSCQ